ncbi:hypothetical protein CSV69_03850 [Sporosarcina sp. P26b]|uniref:hypothetical protein n=1 Tax=Sporosarcina sp. P26b TaxID=2048253 RepID=UPI000C17322D|nr:hypothetical protein [Sporosarcina sp. P26b]PIC96664.1 hypothetical protein CSV69_03850 [Sporosarcina sp. P26b]
MNNRKNENENGYALVIVLFAIVFIMITSAVFMRGSISHAKQEKIVDANNLAYMAAEMGVDYYKWSYINKYNAIKAEIWKKHNDKFLVEKAVINNSEESNKPEAIKKMAKQKRLDALEELYIKLREYNIAPAELAAESYKFTNRAVNVTKDTSAYSIDIIGDIDGKYNSTVKPLEFTLSFVIPEFNVNQADANGTGQQSGEFRSLDWLKTGHLPFINKPSVKCPSITACLETNVENISNFKGPAIYFAENAIKSNSGNLGKDYKSTSIYVVGELGPFNINNMKNINFYAKGNISFKNMNNTDSLNLMTLGNFTVDQAELNRSFIGIRGNFVPKKHLSINASSTLAVKGNWEPNSGKQSITNNSKVCIGGYVNLNQITIDSTSKIYFVLRKATENYPKKDPRYVAINESDYINNPSTLFENCGNSTTNPDTPNPIEPYWEKPEIEVEYYKI